MTDETSVRVNTHFTVVFKPLGFGQLESKYEVRLLNVWTRVGCWDGETTNAGVIRVSGAIGKGHKPHTTR